MPAAALVTSDKWGRYKSDRDKSGRDEPGRDESCDDNGAATRG